MADSVITKQELIDAQKDVKNAGEAVNEKKIVNPRYGAPFKSLPLAIEELNIKADDVIAKGFYTGYATETALKASLPAVSEMRARADDTRKIWRWNRTSAEGITPITGVWIDTGLSELDLAKEEIQKQDKKLSKAFQFAPYSSYADAEPFSDVDKHGVVICGSNVTSKVVDLSTKAAIVIKTPHLYFDDEEFFTEVDKNGVILKAKQVNPISPSIELKPPCYYEILSNGRIHFIYAGGNKLFRLRFGPIGFNGLPNLIGHDIANYIEDYSQAIWTAVDSSSTDRLPPLVIRSITKDDGSTGVIYTGGNHGSSGSASGANTAINRLYQISVDDKQISIGTTKSGYCNHIKALIVNDLMAYNTITLTSDIDKYVVRQTFNINFISGGFGIDCCVQPLPNNAAEVQKDNGPQLVTTGYQAGQGGTQLFLGTDKTRTAFDNNQNSGTKAENPNAFGVCFKSTNGLMAAWVDKSYELGDGSSVATNAPLWRGGEGTNYKFYSAIISGTSGYKILSGATSYRWRGGYAFNFNAESAGLDSSFAVISEQRSKQAIIFTSNLFNITG